MQKQTWVNAILFLNSFFSYLLSHVFCCHPLWWVSCGHVELSWPACEASWISQSPPAHHLTAPRATERKLNFSIIPPPINMTYVTSITQTFTKTENDGFNWYAQIMTWYLILRTWLNGIWSYMCYEIWCSGKPLKSCFWK